jgi:hypothetical protein
MKLTIYQTDRNVRNLYLIPLWGEFLGEPCEYILTDVAYAKISMKKWATTRKAVLKYVPSLLSNHGLMLYRYFIPIIQQLIVACTTLQKPTITQMQEWTSLFVNMYGYFQEYDWVTTWSHPVLVAFWRRTWCDMYASPNLCKFVKVPTCSIKLLFSCNKIYTAG